MRRITLQDLTEFAAFLYCCAAIVGWWQAI